MLDRRSVTHAVEADYQERPRTIVQAVCGAYVRKGDATPTPSCPVCRRWLLERDDEPALRLR